LKSSDLTIVATTDGLVRRHLAIGLDACEEEDFCQHRQQSTITTWWGITTPTDRPGDHL
jgi:hypothetical protein